jgi:hypothetical protein
MLLYYIAVMVERLPFSLAQWGVVPRLALALAAIALVWLGIGAVL